MKSKYINVENMEKAIRKSLTGSGFESEKDSRVQSINRILMARTKEDRYKKAKELKQLFIDYIEKVVENKTTKEMVVFVMQGYTNKGEISDEMYEMLNKEMLVVNYLEYICNKKVKEIANKLEDQFSIIKSCF